MFVIHRLIVSVLATTLGVIGAHAQSPTDAENKQHATDPDVIAAEEFVREIREAAEFAQEAEPAEEVECPEPCTTLDDIIALIQSGPPASFNETDTEQKDEPVEESDDKNEPNG